MKYNIPDEVRAALTRVRDMLANNEIPHQPTDEISALGIAAETPTLFNMNWWFGNAQDCGTVACIGGWTEHILGHGLPSAAMDELHFLFYPGSIPAAQWDSITPLAASRAISQVLADEPLDWASAMAEGDQ